MLHGNCHEDYMRRPCNDFSDHVECDSLLADILSLMLEIEETCSDSEFWTRIESSCNDFLIHVEMYRGSSNCDSLRADTASFLDQLRDSVYVE